MELVILAEKKDGKYRIRNFYPNENKNHLEVAIGDTVVVPEVSPFPFENFSSINEFVPGWKPTYLKVDAEITKEEWDSMHHSGIVYHRFPNRKATILGEFKRPFRYARYMLDYFGDALGTYDLTTWVIHEETRTNDEFKAMSSILAQAISEYEECDTYDLDISFDRYILPYMSQLLKSDIVTFGRHGRNDKSPRLLHRLASFVEPIEFFKALSRIHLSKEEYFNAWYSSVYSSDVKKYFLERQAHDWLPMEDISELDKASSIIGRENVLNLLVDEFMDNMYRGSALVDAIIDNPEEEALENTLGYQYWLSKEDVPLYEPHSEDFYDYDYDWEYDYYDRYYEELEEEDTPEPYDERLEWISTLEKQLQGYATLDEIKDRLPMTHPKLWEDYENYK